jgi:hypothetical protein
MPSIFSPADLDLLRTRVRSLRPDSPRLWGKMGVAQMLAHAQRGLEVATGELKLKRGLLGWLFGGMAKKSLLKDKPFSRGLPTDPTFIVKDARDFVTERDRLDALLARVGTGGPAGLTSEPHPFFGRLTTTEWDALMWKHLDHHLRQFGA